jgi:biopolymer transport protein ExbB
MRGDPSMWGLVLCSIITITFALERLIVLRSSRVMPRTFVDRFMDRLRDGEMDRGKAREMCRDNGSPIARLFNTAVNYSGMAASEIRDAVAEAAQSEVYHLRRRVRALNGIATLAPLLGLFGTVMGMIEAFHALSLTTAGGKTEKLAGGISLALVATASGLCIAIVAAASYYYLLGKVDRIVQEMDILCNEVIDNIAAPRPAEKIATRPRVVPPREQASG